MTTHQFSLFVGGADLTSAPTIQGLQCAGYTHPAAAAHDGVRALVFSRRAEHLVDAVGAVVAETERIPGLVVAREARSGAVAVFHPASLAPAEALTVPQPVAAASGRSRSPARRLRRAGATGSAS